MDSQRQEGPDVSTFEAYRAHLAGLLSSLEARGQGERARQVYLSQPEFQVILGASLEDRWAKALR